LSGGIHHLGETLGIPEDTSRESRDTAAGIKETKEKSLESSKRV